MKKALLFISAGILLTAIAISVIPTSEQKLYTDVIRLHVIANSDSEKDQTVKLSVRDEVLKVVKESAEGAKNYDDAYAVLTGLTDEIKEAAERKAAEEGTPVEAQVYFDREKYPTRYYEDYALPAGEYMSMRVVLGEGNGKNWWCVLFPPLCTSSASKNDSETFFAAGFTPDEYKMIKRDSGVKYKIRFKILELLSDTFGFYY